MIDVFISLEKDSPLDEQVCQTVARSERSDLSAGRNGTLTSGR
jgi:hypothetical protein